MWGEVIGAGIGLLGNLFNKSEDREAQERINAQNLAWAREQHEWQKAEALKNREQQYDFAQHGVRWRVDDAQAAGLHPLAALGAQLSSFSPISVGSTSFEAKAPPSSSVDFSSFGQSLGRAIDAGSSKGERVDREAQAVQRIATTQSLERGELQNELLKSQIALQRAQLPPPFPDRVPLPQPGPTRDVGGLALSEDELKQKAASPPAEASARPYGFNMKHNPWFSDGQSYEDRYGDVEILTWPKGVANHFADMAWNFGWAPTAQAMWMRDMMQHGPGKGGWVFSGSGSRAPSSRRNYRDSGWR